eukprot:scaffold8371_cov66-Phaeocystis_antarctica.AAC.3
MTRSPCSVITPRPSPSSSCSRDAPKASLTRAVCPTPPEAGANSPVTPSSAMRGLHAVRQKSEKYESHPSSSASARTRCPHPQCAAAGPALRSSASSGCRGSQQARVRRSSWVSTSSPGRAGPRSTRRSAARRGVRCHGADRLVERGPARPGDDPHHEARSRPWCEVPWCEAAAAVPVAAGLNLEAAVVAPARRSRGGRVVATAAASRARTSSRRHLSARRSLAS